VASSKRKAEGKEELEVLTEGMILFGLGIKNDHKRGGSRGRTRKKRERIASAPYGLYALERLPKRALTRWGGIKRLGESFANPTGRGGGRDKKNGTAR